MVMQIEKVISSLPNILEPDTLYLVRAGSGFDIRVTDTTGSTAHFLNSGIDTQTDPVFTYNGDLLTRIDYADGSHKKFTYTDGVLTRYDNVKASETKRKDLNYVNGKLTSIVETVI